MNAFESSHQSLKTNEKICQQIDKSDKEMVANLNYESIEFPVSKEHT